MVMQVDIRKVLGGSAVLTKRFYIKITKRKRRNLVCQTMQSGHVRDVAGTVVLQFLGTVDYSCSRYCFVISCFMYYDQLLSVSAVRSPRVRSACGLRLGPHSRRLESAR